MDVCMDIHGYPWIFLGYPWITLTKSILSKHAYRRSPPTRPTRPGRSRHNFFRGFRLRLVPEPRPGVSIRIGKVDLIAGKTRRVLTVTDG